MVDLDKNGKFAPGNKYSFANRPENINRAGRVKGRSLQDELRALLDDEEKGEEVVKALVQTAIQKAIGGDFKFWQEIINRVDGKVAQSHEVDAGSLTFILDEAVKSPQRNGSIS